MILYDEIVRQSSADGTPIPMIETRGSLRGIPLLLPSGGSDELLGVLERLEVLNRPGLIGALSDERAHAPSTST